MQVRWNDLPILKLDSLIFRLFFLIVCAAFCASFLIELSLVVQVNSFQALQAASPDEALMFEVLGNGRVWHFDSGYGPVFWGIFAVLQDIAPEHGEIVFSRVAFIMSKYLAWIIIASYYLRAYGRWQAILATAILVSTPGYLFFGKIISPEYSLLLFASITAVLLLEDDGRLTYRYYLSLFFSCLTTMVKFTALPLLCGIGLYGILLPFLNPQLDRSQLKKFFVIAPLVVVSIWLPVLVACGFKQSIDAIIEILSIAPPMSFEGRFQLAWFRNEITWDRIYIGGIQVDFLPVFCSAIALIFTLVKRRAGHLLITPTDLLVLISVLLIGSVLFKGLATAWYIFMPALLFFIGTFGNMPTGRAAVHSLIGFAILVALLIFGGWDRLSDRVALKAENNAQLIKNEKAFNILLGNYPEIEKCGKSVHLDILVPNITGRTQYLPARLSLRQRSMKIWEEPDYLVVNKYLQDNGSSPLLNFVVKESISNYGIIAKNQELAIYKHNHLKCPTNKK